MVPVLSTLFFLSYVLMVLLIVEQSRTIQSQRVVIQQLLVDSTELSRMKVQAQQHHVQIEAQGQPQKRPKAQFQAPSTRVPAQERPKTRIVVPHRPTMPASDKADLRRSVKLI